MSPGFEQLKSNTPEYKRIHKELYLMFGLASNYDCEYCGKQAKDWSWIHGSDPLDIENYWTLCRSCHKIDDYTDEQREKTRSMMVGNQIARGRHVFS